MRVRRLYTRRGMRIVIVSDVHANLAALEAVLRHAARGGTIDGVWNLGDSVGYGPQPSECIARLRELGAASVVGNHDLAAAGLRGTAEFNPDAAEAAKWTAERLSRDEKPFLAGLPQVLLMPDLSLKAGASELGMGFTLVHGTLRGPVWEYLYSYEAAAAQLGMQRSPCSLVGHTHVPMVVVEDGRLPRGCALYRAGDGQEVLLGGQKLVINPGSVGQPRDGNPLAAYAVYDTAEATVTLRRVEYDVGATQKLMEAAGLPRSLVQRLSEGR